MKTHSIDFKRYHSYVRVFRTLDVPLPEYHSELAAGFDLAIAEDVSIGIGQTVVARTGLVIQAPPGHMLFVTPRSSTKKRWGLNLGNTVGIVDEDYCGPEDEMRLLLHRESTHDIQPATLEVPAGTRLAQGIFVPVTRGLFEEVSKAPGKTRGGWGSTGA